MYWGITPSLDCLQEIKMTEILEDEYNILLLGSFDARHILKTLSRKYRHKKVKINFYVIEGILESVAKQLLLLTVALQPSTELGLVQKTRYFMELFGNTLIRPAVAKYLTSIAQLLVKMITNPDYMKKILPMVNMDVKYKDRDYLENLFKFWCGNDEFNIFEYWDKRVRKSLGDRYDTKMAKFDWDLNMRLRYIGGRQVCSQEYQHFRETGVGFTWLESEVSKPNRSMVSGIIPNGEHFAHYGYLGDMETGPYIAYGLECEDPEYLKSQHGRSVHRATDLTERNLMQMFQEIQTGEPYEHIQCNELLLGTLATSLQSIKVVDVGPAGDTKRKFESGCINFDDLTINFLSFQTFKQMDYKKKYHNFFHMVYFNSAYMQFFQSEIVNKICVDKAILIIENQIFIVTLRDKDLEDYEERVKKKVDMQTFDKLDFDIKKDAYIKFIRKKRADVAGSQSEGISENLTEAQSEITSAQSEITTNSQSETGISLLSEITTSSQSETSTSSQSEIITSSEKFTSLQLHNSSCLQSEKSTSSSLIIENIGNKLNESTTDL